MTQFVEIPLAEGIVTVLDEADHPLVRAHKWYALHGSTGKIYAYGRSTARASHYMHRLIMAAPSGVWIDHINGDGLDNRRANLRIATAGQNRANAGKNRHPSGKPRTSQYKGVNWDRSRGRWQAKIRADGHHRTLGRYDIEAEAARAYDAAARAHWGEFAFLNFPDGEGDPS